MPEKNIPVDVICICSSDGEIRPLRFRMEQPEQILERVDIDEIVCMTQVRHTGAEATIYRCRAAIGNQAWMFDLKYLVRGHRWYLTQKG